MIDSLYSTTSPGPVLSVGLVIRGEKKVTHEELMKDFWMTLRAEEIARSVADPTTNPEEYWASFEGAFADATLEWTANYEGKRFSRLKGPHIDEAKIMLASWVRDEKANRKMSSTPTKLKNGASTTGSPTPVDSWSLVPKLSKDHPIYKAGWIIGQRRSPPSSRDTRAKNKRATTKS
jgi:hypothetical protein